MIVVKKINNNVAIGVDGNNREVVLFGKGIGFPSMPYELKDLAKVDRTFYDVSERYYKLFEEIDADLFNMVAYMVDVIQSKFPGDWDKNLTFVLADHINFSLQRIKMDMRANFPYSYEIKNDFPEFHQCARWIVQNINKKMKVHMEKGEITCITMHLVSAFEGTKNDGVETRSEKSERILNTITKIIEKFFGIKINRESLNFSRFRYHIQYFVKRKEEGTEVLDESIELYETMKNTYPETFECVCLIDKFLNKEYGESCSTDELLYLMIHINRLYSKEDCNRKGITQE